MEIGTVLRLGLKPAELTQAARETLGTVFRIHQPHFDIKGGVMVFRRSSQAEHALGMLNSAGIPLNLGSRTNLIG